MRLLDPKIKKAAEDAFHDNALLSLISLEDREIAAQYYEATAQEVKGPYTILTWRYNLERAKFLRGQVKRIVYRALDFQRELDMISEKGES